MQNAIIQTWNFSAVTVQDPAAVQSEMLRSVLMDFLFIIRMCTERQTFDQIAVAAAALTN
jgi:hypothetical protein